MRQWSGPRPRRSVTPGRKPSISASAFSTSLRTASIASGFFRSNATERRPRLSRLYFGSIAIPKPASAARSIRNTSAPMSDSSIAHIGPGPIPASSMTRYPDNTPMMLTSERAYFRPRTFLFASRPRHFCSHACTFGRRRNVELHHRNPAHDGGHVQVGDRKILAEQIFLALERFLERVERRLQSLDGGQRGFLVALIGRSHHAIDQKRDEMRLDFGHRKEAPLVDVGAGGGIRRPQRILAVLLGQVEIDRHRFPNHDAVVFEHRHMAVGIELEMRGPTWPRSSASGDARR